MEWGPAPESASPANEWLDTHRREFALFIGGEWKQPESGRKFDTENPATGKSIAKLSQATRADVDAAVQAAKQAQPEWWAIGCHGRARYLYAIARQIQKHSRFLAVLESRDNGKPIRETRDLDIPLAARHFYYHAGCAQLMESEMAGYEPVGVCGQIIPWNFPLLMLAWKIAPALAMGNTVVLKPAEFTSLTALAFAEICERVGLPKGVVNIITGDGATGKLLVEHPDVNKIAFTGSTEVGRQIRKATAGTGKKLTLELGGKSPFIIFDDADLDSAVEGLVDAIWFNQGQVCCAGSRLLVQESVSEQVIAKIKARMDRLRIGDPLDKAIDVGAIVAEVQLKRISELVEQGRQEGAELYQAGCECPKEGWFYPPTLLTNVGPASTVSQVEIFGPVLVAMTFRTSAEAVELANNTVYGLAASVWTENINLAHDIAAKVKAGTVWLNCTNQFDAAAGFGGYRESGYGREGGKEGLWSYLRRKPAQPRGQTPIAQAEKAIDPAIDRTHKLYIGGKQARPDGGLSVTIGNQEVGRGNRKDIRNAVEAASSALKGWQSTTPNLRAQIIYYIAENLEGARNSVGASVSEAEFDASLQSLFTFAAKSDKFDGQVHPAPFKGIVYTANEPLGVVGVICTDEAPLGSVVGALASCIAMGNTVVLIAPEKNPLPAVELYRVLEASDVPAGVVNIVTGLHKDLVSTLVDHDGVDAIWALTPGLAEEVERLSVGNLKQTWISETNWIQEPLSSPDYILRHATQVKNVWTPVGE